MIPQTNLPECTSAKTARFSYSEKGGTGDNSNPESPWQRGELEASNSYIEQWKLEIAEKKVAFWAKWNLLHLIGMNLIE